MTTLAPARPTRRLLRLAGAGLTALLTLGSNALAGGTLYTSIAPGSWTDPGVWDLGGVPGAGPDDQARVNHGLLVEAPTPFINTCVIAPAGEEQRVTVTDGGTFNGGQVFLGADLDSGILRQEGGTSLLTENLVLGLQRPGFLEVAGGSLSTPSLEVGATAGSTIPGSFGGLRIEGGAGNLSADSLHIGEQSETRIEPAGNGLAGLTTIQAVDVTVDPGALLIVAPTYEALVGDSWDLVHFSGTLTGSFGNVIAFNGLGIALDTSTPGVLRALVTSSPYPLAGNTCANALPATIGGVTNANYADTFITGPDTACGAPFEGGSELWFEVVNPGSEVLCLRAEYRELSGFPFFQGRLELWDDCGGTLLACDGYTDSNDPIEVSLSVPAGGSLLLRTTANIIGGVGMALEVQPQACTWTDLGGGSAGVAGVPSLEGTGGPLTQGAGVALALSQAPSTAPVLLVLSASSAPLNVLGGTVHAFPWIVEIVLATDTAGQLTLTETWPAGVPAGTGLWAQFLCRDLSVPAGITLSNAVTTSTPD